MIEIRRRNAAYTYDIYHWASSARDRSWHLLWQMYGVCRCGELQFARRQIKPVVCDLSGPPCSPGFTRRFEMHCADRRPYGSRASGRTCRVALDLMQLSIASRQLNWPLVIVQFFSCWSIAVHSASESDR